MKASPAWKLPGIVALAALTAIGLAACGGSSGSSSSGSQAAAGKPVAGGTLNVISDTGPGELDPVPTYNYAGYELERGYTRQLVTYPTGSPATDSGPAWNQSTTLVADAAAAVPSTANGLITDGGTEYTYHIRPGVDWNSSPPRQVTADDFIREFKAFCNPKFPVGNSTYFTSTIVGFESYCTAENNYFGAKTAPTATAAAVAGWQNSHTIAGLSAPGPLTLQVRLTEPASDFNNIMALPFVSARPVEYDAYLPGSEQLNEHTISDGPYQITSYVPNKTLVMTRNPAWKQSTDPVRHQYVSKVIVTMGVSSDQTVLTDIQSGSQDLFLADLGIPSQSVAGLLASHDSRLRIWPSGNLNPNISFNLRSPNASGAMSKLKVRQAIEYGIDKAAIARIEGGLNINTILTQSVPPGSAGFQPKGYYLTPGNAGDPARCKAELASAGYPHGLTLNYLYPNDSNDTTLFQSIQGSLRSCGITLVGKSAPSGGAYFTDLGNVSETNKPGTWDLSTGSWFPDWYGNNGRSTIQALYQTNCTLGTVNSGCYSSPVVDNLIKEALKAPTAAAAAALWSQANTDVMNDAPIVPLLSSNDVEYASNRVHSSAGGVNFSTLIQGWDFTTIWLNPSS